MISERFRVLSVGTFVLIGLLGVPLVAVDSLRGRWPGGEDPRLPPRQTWRLSGSVNLNRVHLMVDSDPRTRWDTGRAQEGGEWIEVDLGDTYPLRRLILDSEGSPHDVPQSYRVEVAGGKHELPVSVSGATPFLVTGTLCIDLPPGTSGRTVRVVQTGRCQYRYWSVHELYLTAGSTLGNIPLLLGAHLQHIGWFVVAPSTLLVVLCLLVDRGKTRPAAVVLGLALLAVGGLSLRFAPWVALGRAFILWGSVVTASLAAEAVRLRRVS